MRGARLGFGLVAALICVLLLAATASADTIWWGNTGASGNNFGHASTAGGEGGTFTPTTAPVSTPFGLAIDSATGTAYWVNESNSTIGWAKLDGSEEGTLKTAVGTVSSPLGIAIDTEAGKVFWANAGNSTIAWAATDGSGGAILDTTGAPVNHPQGVVLDPVDGKIYWANREGESIGYANLDGSGDAGELAITGTQPNDPNGLAIDAAQDRIYWTEANGNAIHYAPLGGGASGVLAVGSAPVLGARGLAIDPEAGKIYWANLGGSIGVAALDGSGGSQLDTTGATISEPTYPVVFETPKAAAAPTLGGSATVGSTLTCTPGTWRGDLVESLLYRAPERTSVGWTLDGAPLNGATGTTLVANQGGTYACEGIATDGAGTTVATSAPILVPGPTTPAGTVSVRLEPAPSVQVTKVKYDRHHGTATVLAKVSGPGRLYLSGKQVARRGVRSSGAGIAKLKVTAKGGALNALKKTGNAKVKIALKFVASEGGVATASRSLTLRLRP